jgi:hypothetical protein
VLRMIAEHRDALLKSWTRFMAELTTKSFEEAVSRGEVRMRSPRAVNAHYDTERDRVIIRLTTGIEIGLTPHDVEGLRGAAALDLAVIEVEELGLGIHFPRLDADLYVPALFEGILGSAKWMAENAITETLAK